MEDTFECGNCHKTFKKTGQKHEDMVSEWEIVSGEEARPEDLVHVCDDCWKRIVAWMQRSK